MSGLRCLFCFSVAALIFESTVARANVTVETNVAGTTPAVVGYDSGHFYPGSNTGDWWRYSGVTGARLFVAPGDIEPTNQFPSIGNTVTNASSFLNLKAAVRADPWNQNYLNWSFVTNRFATHVLTGTDYILVDYALSNLQQNGVSAVIDTTATTSEFSVTTWTGQWQLWQYYYQEAFYLGYAYNVQRYQMYNEPDDGGPTGTNYLIRLQLASDAIQSAIADVNTMYGKSLTPMVLAPVTAGAPTSSYATWGELVITNRHINFLGQSNADFLLAQKYDYHEYGGSPPSPSGWATELTYLQGQISASMAPETPIPATLSEFNIYDGSVFNSLPGTLDSPTNYSAFGSIAVNLLENGINEIYCFKISQTVGSGYIAKNGTHYVDNTNAPYNIGGITKGGEVWRLINKGFAPGRNLLGYQAGGHTPAFNFLASYDPVLQRYYFLSVNDTTSAGTLAVDLSGWNIPTNNQLLVEAVNENCYGGGYLLTNAGSASTFSATQGSNSVWLLTIPAQAQQAPQVILASANAQVNDGANKNVNYSGGTNLTIEDNSTNASYRSAALLQFQVPSFNPTNLQLALLTVTASSAHGANLVQAYVYGLLTNTWSENSVTWATAPNLAQGVAPGTAYTNNFLLGAGSTAFLQGQLVAGSTPGQYVIDVTSFLRSAASSNVSFLLAREVRYLGDAQDGDGVSITSREGSASAGPRLQLIFNAAPIPIVPPSLALQSSAGSPQLGLTGMSGSNFVVQYTSNLPGTNWINLFSVTNLSNSPYLYTDPAGFSAPSRFYRALMR